jgi:hypothetical protein
MLAVPEVLVTSLSMARPLMDLAAEYYQSITVDMWLEMPEGMIGAVPPHRRALAAVLNSRARKIARGGRVCR